MKIRNAIVCLGAVLLLSACSTPKLGYFQNLESGEAQQIGEAKVLKVQPGDKLSILVSSKSPELAYMFNKPIVGRYSSSTSGANLSTTQVSSYTVDENGNIEFPVLGQLNIAGKTRSEVSRYIKDLLVSKNLLKDATVTVDFLDLYFSVLGEVKEPGRFIIDHDKVTLIDALSRAGDLTIYGKRDNVLVMREEGGKQVSYRVDLTNAKSLYESPVYYLQQNDLVYVTPNDVKVRQSTVNGNTFRSTSFWISLASLLTSVAVLIFK